MKKIFLISLFLISCNSNTDLSFNTISIYPDTSNTTTSIETTISIEETNVQRNNYFGVQRVYTNNTQTFVEDDGYFLLEYQDENDNIIEFTTYFRFIRYTDIDGKIYDIGYSESGSYNELIFLHSITEFYFDSNLNDYVNNNLTYEVPLGASYNGTLNSYIDDLVLSHTLYENNVDNADEFITMFKNIFAPVLDIPWQYNYQL